MFWIPVLKNYSWNHCFCNLVDFFTEETVILLKYSLDFTSFSYSMQNCAKTGGKIFQVRNNKQKRCIFFRVLMYQCVTKKVLFNIYFEEVSDMNLLFKQNYSLMFLLAREHNILLNKIINCRSIKFRRNSAFSLHQIQRNNDEFSYIKNQSLDTMSREEIFRDLVLWEWRRPYFLLTEKTNFSW